MNVAIVGAGIIGVTTAYELALRGHAVTVIERQESVAAQASFAHACLLSAGAVAPAAGRGLRRWMLRGLWTQEAALRWRPGLSGAQWRWLVRWWQACGHNHAPQVRAMVGLAQASLLRLRQISERHAISFENGSGVLLLLAKNADLSATHRHVQMLRELGVSVEESSVARTGEIEPSLHRPQRLAGALHLPGDGVGNCRQFAQQLREVCERELGVRFRFNEAVAACEKFERGWQVRTAKSLAPEPFDAVVLCGGSEALASFPALARRIPMAAVSGWSLTYRLRIDGQVPRSAVVDMGSGVTITRLGERLRVTGGFRLGPVEARTPAVNEASLKPLLRTLDRWFPSAAERAHPQAWQGSRPMLADGPPLIGPAHEPGLWLNIGHGAHGWTLACGAAELLAQQFDNASGLAREATLAHADAFQLNRPRD